MTAKVNADNLFHQGICVSLSHGFYQASYRLPKEKFESLPVEEQEMVRGTFDGLLKKDKKLIKEIISYDNKTLNTVKGNTIFFPIRGVVFVTANKVDWLNEYIEKRTGEERQELIQKAADNYESAIKAFEEKIPTLYEIIKDKYPSKERFINRFYFRFNIFQVSIPDDSMEFVSDSMKRSAIEKMKSTVNDMKRNICNTIYTEVLEATKKIEDRASNGKSNQATFNKLQKIFETVENVYGEFVDRKDIKEMIEKVKVSVDGVNAKELRDNDSFRKDFGKEIKAVVKEVESLPNVELTRALLI